jgi:FG-GAP-like repeat
VSFWGQYMRVARDFLPRFRFSSLLHAAVFSILLAGAAFAANPIPSVVGPVSPQAVAPGSGSFTLTVYGANFVSGAVVNWNGSPRSTTFLSARELQAQILASDVTIPTAGFVTVTNPPPGGGASSSSYAIVEVHTPTSTIVAELPHLYVEGGWPDLAADFNHDGKLDLALGGPGVIDFLLGNGDGTFQKRPFAARDYCQFGGDVRYGDFNGDGNLDLVFAAGDSNNPPTHLGVNLGEGNGSFRRGSRSGEFLNCRSGIAVGDFNGDGKLDAATVDGVEKGSVFLGNGDGTFQRPKFLPGAASSSFYAITGDFTGDGKLDLVLESIPSKDTTVLYILPGNGDGTFQKGRTITSVSDDVSCGAVPAPHLVASDFNGDGKLDLAFCLQDPNGNGGEIGILLGNGDGTFKKPVFYSVPGILLSFAVGDFNSDGITDLVADYNIQTKHGNVFEFALFLGNGDGTFQKRTIIDLPGTHEVTQIVPGDFNSDGLLDFAFSQPNGTEVFVQK